MGAKSSKQNHACDIHGAPSRAANRALVLMVAASLSLIIWHVWVYGPSGQTTSAGSATRPFPLLIWGEIWDLVFNGHGIVAELRDILPYFLVGIFLAGYMRTYKIATRLQKSMRRHGILSVFLATLIGMITPLCACGTLTTAISLIFARFPLAPVMALLITSPLLSPTTYLLTLNDLGPEWTAIRAFAAFLMGIFAGVVTYLLRDKGFQTGEVLIEGAVPLGDFHDKAYPDERLRCNCKERFGNRVAAKTGNMFLVFLAKSSEMLWLVGKYVLVGVSIGAVVERYMPYEWIYRLFGERDPLSIVWVTLGSVPIFLHQISASSILYHIKSSLHGTLDGGAGLAFMIGGPVTAIPTMVMFWTVFKKRVFFLYMFICIVGTILISYAFQFFVFVPGVDMGNPLLADVSSLSGGSASVINKQNKDVQMVMDPGGKGMIATYSNDVNGEGGIVFDSGFGRFLDGSADKFDNRKYAANIAEWLKENNTFSSGKRILVYDTFTKSGVDGKAISGKIVEALERKGFAVRVTDRRDTPRISERLLEPYDQLWLFFGGEGPGLYFGGKELEAVSRFVDDGKGMLIVAGEHPEDSYDMAAANSISSRYGVVFSGSVKDADKLHVSSSSYFLDKTSAILGRVLKFMHKA